MYRVEIIAAQGSIFRKIPLPLGRGISVNVIWGKRYEKRKRKRGKCRRKRKKKKEERGKKRQSEVKG
jgi:hypothetical protein